MHEFIDVTMSTLFTIRSKALRDDKRPRDQRSPWREPADTREIVAYYGRDVVRSNTFLPDRKNLTSNPFSGSNAGLERYDRLLFFAKTRSGNGGHQSYAIIAARTKRLRNT